MTMSTWKNEKEAREQIKSQVSEYYHQFKESRKPFEPGNRINYAGRVFDEREMCALTDAALDFWLTSGRFCEEFEKDFAKLESKFRGRGDWRTVDIGKLSAAEEATRQVALAKEEQRAAQESLKQIEANTRGLAEKLDELLTAKEGA